MPERVLVKKHPLLPDSRANSVGEATAALSFLEQMEQLQAPYADLRPAARTALLDVLVRRRFKWPRPVREAMLEQFERWRVWKAQPARIEQA